MNALSLTLVMPIFNERECLSANFASVVDFLGRSFPDYELIVVESGSTDGSDAFLAGWAAKDPRIKLLREGARNGFGAAVKLGFKHVTKSLVVVQVIDMPYPLEYLEAAAHEMATVDYVISFRMQDERSISRRAMSKVYNALVRRLIGLHVTNVNSALKLYRSELVKELDLTSNGWTVDAEILLKLERGGFRCKEIPVPLIDRTTGKSTVGFYTPFKMLWDLVLLRRSIEKR